MDSQLSPDRRLASRFLWVTAGIAAGLWIAILLTPEHRSDGGSDSAANCCCQHHLDEPRSTANGSFNSASEPALVLDRVPAERIHLAPTHGVTP